MKFLIVNNYSNGNGLASTNDNVFNHFVRFIKAVNIFVNNDFNYKFLKKTNYF